MGDHAAAQTIQPDSTSGTTSRRQLLAAAGIGAAGALVPVSAARAHGIDEGFTGNVVIGEVVGSSDGVLQVKRLGDDAPLTVVTNSSTKLPDPAIARAKGGQVVGINAPQIARAKGNATLTATVVAPCVLGEWKDAKRLRDGK